MHVRRKFSSLLLVIIWLTLLLGACSDAPAAPSSGPTTSEATSASSSSATNTGQITAAPAPAADANVTPSTFAYKADKTFIFGLAQPPVAFNDQIGLDPANLTDHSSLLLVRQIYETLFQFKPGQMGYQNGTFVRNVSVSPDELTYSIKLLRGIRFSDGRILDAQAIKFNFDRWSKEGVYHKGDFQTWGNYFGGFPGDILDKVEVAPDNLTVDIRLKREMASFFQVLSMPQFGIVSPSAFDANGYFARPIGSGPYIAEKPVRGETNYIVLKANPNYLIERDTQAIQPPALNTIVATVLRSGQDGLTEIKRGTISATDKIRPETLNDAKSDPALKILYREALNISFLSLNQARPPFNQREIRQAFAYAINTRNLVSHFYNGLGQPAAYFLPPAAYASLPASPYPYDPDRARQLLTLAGYPNGSGFPVLDLWVLPVPRLYYPDPRKIAEAIRADLAAIGLTVNIRDDKEWAAFREDRDQGKFNLFMNGWQGNNGDPDEFLGYFFGQTKNEDGYDNANVQNLIKQGRETLDLAARRAIYKEAQETIYNDFAVIPLAYTQYPLALRPDIKGYLPHPSGIESWSTVSFSNK